MEKSLQGWQDPVEKAIADLISKGFVDVTAEVERYPGGEEKYVFRGPDGVLYHCWANLYVGSVLAESQLVASMMRWGLTDTHFYRARGDGLYHCDVRIRDVPDAYC